MNKHVAVGSAQRVHIAAGSSRNSQAEERRTAGSTISQPKRACWRVPPLSLLRARSAHFHEIPLLRRNRPVEVTAEVWNT